MSWLEEKYVSLGFSTLRNFRQKRNDPPLYNFSCPICGDSETDKTKARGYLYENEGRLKYKCHNCSVPMTFSQLLKHINPDLYRNFIVELFGEKKSSKKKEVVPKVGKQTEKILQVHKEDPLQVLEPLSDEHRSYLKARKIENVDGFYSIANMNRLKPFLLEKEIKLKNEDRIVIPVLNFNRKVVGVVCRTSDEKNTLRYINLKMSEEPMIYNAPKVNPKKTIYVFEGIMDSTFVSNSVAVCGSDLTKAEELFEKNRLVLVYDNQPKNREIAKKMENAINQGFSVVIWPEGMDRHGKDINKLITNGFSSDKVYDTIRENTFKGMTAFARFKKWKKIV